MVISLNKWPENHGDLELINNLWGKLLDESFIFVTKTEMLVIRPSVIEIIHQLLLEFMVNRYFPIELLQHTKEFLEIF